LKRKIYAVHKWCGLIAGLFISLMGISGAILVFHDEIEQHEHRDLWHIDNDRAVNIDNAYILISRKFPNADIRIIRFSKNPKETLIFSLKSKDYRVLVFAHPSQGTILKIVDNNTTVRQIILNFHYSFYSGSFGKVFVFIIGLIFLISLLTGLFIYRKSFARIILFRSPFNRKSSGGMYASVHHYIGVWALILNLMLVITGSLIAFDNLSHGAALSNDIPHTKVSIDRALNSIRKRYPNFTATYIRYPTALNASIEINGKVKDDPFYWTQYYNKIEVNTTTGDISNLVLTSQSGKGKKTASLVGVLHLVEFKNIWAKILFCLAGLSAPVLSITGFFMWKRKRRQVVR